MKKFWSSFLAALLAFVVGSIIVQCITLFFFFGIIASTISSSVNNQERFSLDSESVLKLNIQAIPEKVQEIDFNFYKEIGKNPTLTDMIRAIQQAKKNPKIEGIYIENPLPMMGMASLYELRNALTDFKTSGKWIVAYADQYTQAGYYLASVADNLYLNPQGMIELKGLATSSLFYRNALKKIGVEMTILKVGTYKGAVEPFLLDEFSEPNKEQIRSYMNGLWDEIRTKICTDRKIAPQNLDSLVNQGLPFFAPDRYTSLALADGLLYEREVTDKLKEKIGLDDEEDLSFVSPMELLAARKKQKNSDRDGEIVVCYAEGVINDSSATSSFSKNTITEKLADELIEYAQDDDYDAIVLRVNSPGGSAYVSDQIWDAVKYVRTKKPLVVSMGDYAASGGYYISCAADYIFAEPVTITGSIGIYGMIPNLSGLATKIDLRQDVVKTHQYADAMSSLFQTMSPGERTLMQAYIERGYDTFISRVADGRKISKAMVDSVGQGRVWTGKQALERKLVDELGGLQEAIEKAASLAKIGSHYKVRYKKTNSLRFENILDLFTNQLGEKMMMRILSPEEIDAIKNARDLRSMEGAQAILPYQVIL